MARKLIMNHKCPFCGYMVGEIPDHVIRQHPHEYNVEFVLTKKGMKQYFHTKCWNVMIEERKHLYEHHEEENLTHAH